MMRSVSSQARVLATLTSIVLPYLLQAQRAYGIFQDENAAWKMAEVSVSQGTFIAEHPIDDLVTWNFIVGSTIDPVNQWLIYAGYDAASDLRYFVQDLKTGEILHNPVMEDHFSVYQIHWNPNDSNIYAMASNPEGEGHILVKVNPQTGDHEKVQTFPNIEHVFNGSIISANNSYVSMVNNYADPAGAHRFYNIHLEDSTINTDVLCEFEYPEFPISMVSNFTSNNVYGVIREGTSSPYAYSLVQFDVPNGTMDLVVGLESIVVQSQEAFCDPYSQSISLSASYLSDDPDTFRILTYDLQSGDLLFDPVVDHRLRLLEFLDIELTGSSELSEISMVQLFPNPATDRILIHSAQPIEKIEIFNIQGDLVHYQINNSQELAVDISFLPVGYYLLDAKIDGENIMQRMIVVR